MYVPQMPTLGPVGTKQPVAGRIETHDHAASVVSLQRRHHEAMPEEVPQINLVVRLPTYSQQSAFGVPGHPRISTGELQSYLSGLACVYVHQAHGRAVADEQLRPFGVPQ